MEVFYIDDQPVPFEKGEKILSAALRAGLEIPHFCYHPALSVVATCRMCLVDVTDLGNGRPAPKLMTSCSTDAMPNMRISTKNDKVQEGRELVMEYLLVNHPLDCPICDQSGECTLQDHSYAHGTGHSEMEYNKRVMAGVTLVLLSSWSAIVVFIVPAVTASHVRSQEQTSSECSIVGMS
jgi:NADH-quinone oxidoreductase subunit G